MKSSVSRHPAKSPMPHSIKDSIIGAHLHGDARQRSDGSSDSCQKTPW
jgi:hypothetical protein